MSPSHSSSHSSLYSSRSPRKSSSHLSLRQATKVPSTIDISGPSPSRSRPYFEVYPRPNSSPSEHPPKPRSRKTDHPALTSPFHSSVRDPQSQVPSQEESSYIFPSLASEEIIPPTSSTTPKPYSRTRTRTSPSRKSHWEAPLPPLCFSGSSSTQHTVTPPHTPIDLSNHKDLFEGFPVVVAAPVTGIETMDALVDGMNGGDVTRDFPTLLNRNRFGIPGHHPLYQPPLPTPPPGIVLGKGKGRRQKKSTSSIHSSDSEDENENVNTPHAASRSRRRPTRKTSARATSSGTITPPFPLTRIGNVNAKDDDSKEYPKPDLPSEDSKATIPSISEIIRNHTIQQPQTRFSTTYSSHTRSQGHSTVHEGYGSGLEKPDSEQDADIVSRSSIDSVADEVQKTLRTQLAMKPPPAAPPSSFPKRHSTFSDNASLFSPRSDPGGGGSSVYSISVSSHHGLPSPLDSGYFLSTNLESKSSPQAVAQYLRSARLTTLLKLTRSPHASQDNPLTVSLSDLGSQTGFPVVVFLGLGCVRHIMGLYDEMAEFLGLRLITIDRWGLGRTEPRAKSAKGIIQWASVVEEVLDLLRIGQCSIMAHSAGAPYSLSFANKLPARIRGDVCLLAPWVGGSENSGYKWLKYVPNGILKTAQAAEWKIQAWMIGKPPTITYEGIGYDAQKSSSYANSVYPSQSDRRPRPSIGSSSFSEYDDLGDFEGRFESRSTLGACNGKQVTEGKFYTTKRKSSKGFLDRLKGSSVPQEEKSTGRKLKALRSMGSLKGKSNGSSRKSNAPSPQILPPPPLQIEVGLGFNDLEWTRSVSSEIARSGRDSASIKTGPTPRLNGHRSTSFGCAKNAMSVPSSPTPSAMTFNYAPSVTSNNGPQMTLGNALIAASHAESAKGTHNDLLQILNHDNQPWGFSYSSYPHKVRVWYGDRDEKIAENAVRWMERTMGEDRCFVKVVKGADHALMYNTKVVLEVFDYILSTWKVNEPIARRPMYERR
ncbi:hypothetical protein AMATHDRAFT_72431 [Amanita thiersii Skay4041]|uniref:AB hydrolase-1 domain-containing protein n=1 Tax=Amanita thiersii Skay4041 TaxID=703135 RepID=A0A2A9NYI0_9AGAR|nr:hypothetical protein AMATHDRAFT_72431 [Amanita thiersii Skay4041]